EKNPTILINAEDDYHYMNYIQMYKFGTTSERTNTSIESLDQTKRSNTSNTTTSNTYNKDCITFNIYNGTLPAHSFSYIYTGNNSNEENTCTYARSISTRLYRVFNNTLEDGGRFYGAQYQRIEKGLRK